MKMGAFDERAYGGVFFRSSGLYDAFNESGALLAGSLARSLTQMWQREMFTELSPRGFCLLRRRVYTPKSDPDRNETMDEIALADSNVLAEADSQSASQSVIQYAPCGDIIFR